MTIQTLLRLKEHYASIGNAQKVMEVEAILAKKNVKTKRTNKKMPEEIEAAPVEEEEKTEEETKELE